MSVNLIFKFQLAIGGYFKCSQSKRDAGMDFYQANRSENTANRIRFYTQSPIIKNGPIRNDAEILGKLKE